MLFLIAAALLQQVIPASPPAQPDAVVRDRAGLDAITEAIGAGRLEEAATLIGLRRAGPVEAEAGELTLLEGELSIERGDILAAERQVTMVSETEATHCRLARIRGLALAERQQADAAIDKLGDVAEFCAADWRVWTALGRLFADRRESAASRFAFENAIRLADDRASVHADFARALIDFGDLDAAGAQARLAQTASLPDADAQRLVDYLTGMRGIAPQRAGENDELWGRRLGDAAEGARRVNNEELARALFGRALLLSPRYDQRLLSEASRR